MSNLDKTNHQSPTSGFDVNNIFNKGLDFASAAMHLFQHQYTYNTVYGGWCKAINLNAANVNSITEIAFLPISFFKTHAVKTGDYKEEIIFTSSGTTQTVNSRHLVKDAAVYKTSFINAFEMAYGNIEDWCVIGLLPSYLERQGSSLIYMAEELIKLSKHPLRGFYLDEFEKLAEVLDKTEKTGQPVLLIGVTFALLDFAEKYRMNLTKTVVMETGGMKGRRRELTRQEVHNFLKEQLGIRMVHSEYGMTELLSQAYSKGDGKFICPPWMKVLVRDEEDPFAVSTHGKGILNIIDLANADSCAFIATDDAGVVYEDGSFEVWGRVDNSDIRGCSLLVV